MKYVDLNQYDLERFESEKRTEEKRKKLRMIKFLKQIMSGKANYHQRNIVYVGKKIPKLHLREFIVTVKIKGLTNVHAVV